MVHCESEHRGFAATGCFLARSWCERLRMLRVRAVREDWRRLYDSIVT
jgi:hypothetical protein